MAAPIGFPDGVAVVRAYLHGALVARGAGLPVGTRVPDPRPPRFIRLERVGGARLDLVTDRPRIDVQCWGESEEAATDLATLARALLFAMPGWRGAVAYDVAEVGGPNTLPDPESGQDRVAFAVEVSLRGARLDP
ncbi:hypothetical protein ACIQPP_05600 [Streptomyces violaceusniger]|uniref:hypothetical protein n=1 Tax=Streptomyces violaceusniger TaxID=68280 RepID=UPI000998A8D9|nr:hypothetical protein [Streptomyces hygroscopicus]AQW55295.1 hypothetical protein SHXM_08758 [Streptomyces hygroscopicus]